MDSAKPKSLDALNVEPSEADYPTADASPDTEANADELNNLGQDFDNVDSPVPEDVGDEESSVADRQMGTIS
jgi:hypothetical protein